MASAKQQGMVVMITVVISYQNYGSYGGARYHMKYSKILISIDSPS